MPGSSRQPDVDLIITFRTSKKASLSKQQTREDARKAEQQYRRLTETLSYAGLKSVGRRGEGLGHLLVFVICPIKHVEELVRRERYSDFLSGLPVTPVANLQPLSPAERIRLIHSYITSTPKDGGLGISPDAPEWDLVESIFPLHDREFNENWIRAWKPRNQASIQLEKIRDQFGDSIALYFAFLSSYTSFLVVPAILGLTAHFLFPPYAPIYSILLSIWSIAFVEWWRVHERILSLRFGTRGSFRVEKRRIQHKPGMSWWARELRVLASVPIIILFTGLLSAILTAIFVFEAFVTRLYEGPGKKLITFSPTLLFVILVPRVLEVYQAIAVRLTKWENHAQKSSYTASLTLKTFALSALVAFMGLGLSAFVYVPFGEGMMYSIQAALFNGSFNSSTDGFTATLRDMLNGTFAASSANEKPQAGIWNVDRTHARAKLDPGRLRDQMFAYTVTGQVMDTFTEIGLPFLLRRLDAFRKGKTTVKGLVTGDNGSVKKRVVFEDEKEKGGMEERAFLDSVREEAALPEYDLFVDYNEMVVQFGYVVLWSTIWPLAGVMAFINNIFELRSDAFKIAVHNRRAIPSRTDTIGPWLDALTFLTWLGALTNSALVYLFSPQLLTDDILINAVNNSSQTPLGDTDPSLLASASGALPTSWGVTNSVTSSTLTATNGLLLKAILVSLVASHGFILLRALIRHIVEKVFWSGSGEVEEREKEERSVKAKFLSGPDVDLGSPKVESGGSVGGFPREAGEKDSMGGFWDHDEGLEEIQRISKEA
ncbi:DUF590-domain-containing protein [Phlegmacium glaucopus]|nr:DUF590-domain-containing protein [Phlegmacium glaucopus]